jgi:hypothetical protein
VHYPSLQPIGANEGLVKKYPIHMAKLVYRSSFISLSFIGLNCFCSFGLRRDQYRALLTKILKAEGALPAQTLVRTSKYLNNMIEQDHRRVKQRCYPMLGFKAFGNAEVTLSRIELANKIKKGQFNTSEITARGP